MIPIKLTLQGIYSYQKREVIDFEKLTQSGLFGIFGMVGSGKSTILEAISYALYGQVERLNKNDRVAYNMMNLKSNDLYIDFEFVSPSSQRYRFVVKSERKKVFDDIKTPERIQYQWIKDEWIPIEIQADDILELSYDNFRRTIIIPQGKFQEFLQLGDADRTRMLKEIFNLYEYDLSDKILPLEKENNDALLTTQTNLEQVKDVSFEVITERKIELNDLKISILQNLELLNQKKAQKTELEQVKALFEEILAKENQLDLLKNEDAHWQQAQIRLKEYEICLFQFKDLLENKQAIALKINNLEQEILQKEKLYEQIDAQLKIDEEKFSAIKEQYEQREKLHQQTEEWHKIRQIKNLQIEIAGFSERISKGKPLLEGKIKELSDLEKEAEIKRNLLKENKSELPDRNKLHNLTVWFEQRTNILTARQSAEKEVKIYSNEIQKVITEKNKFIQNEIEPWLNLNNPAISLEDLLEELEFKKVDLEDEQKRIQTEINELEVKSQLQNYAINLKDGEPCPLCGAVHHPEILVADVLQEHNEVAQNRKLAKETELRNLNEMVIQLHSFQHSIQEKERSLEKYNRKLDQEISHYDVHLSKFIWRDFEPDYPEDVEKLNDKAKRIQTQISELEDFLEKNDKTKIEVQKEKEKFQTALDSIEKENIAKNSELQALEKQIVWLKEEKIAELSESAILDKINELEQNYQVLTKNYQYLESQILSARQQESALKSEIKIRRENLLNEQKSEVDILSKMQNRMTQSDFKDLHQVETILAQNLNIEVEKSQIQVFYTNFNKLQESLKDLRQRADNKVFVENDYQILLAEIVDLNNQTTEQQKEETRLEEQIKRLETDLLRKQQLEKKMADLEMRGEDIAEMKKLFRSEGFVKYVSTVYLQNLCNLANERFYKLTRQRLQLELNENNNFQVRDFLNNGQVRSVKTLSGGQTFQASLSLALALADSIQRFTKSSQNFFFLDEGFGSQDDESLEIVFNTLASLRHENRIVGIISHVEKLKDEIKVFLKIRNDEEEGSSIEKSWEADVV